ncbi:ER degradation-enhancing alpha-mannosidase-like protein 2 [Haliotis rubra]|uniref:ER degradation-enhancing alpha-mannosidase-like protein 2 n=1 Tax=Haliotis rubra TaxID=36100 RepID=UPI001EE5C9A3|nr:ER degradation-enhancing alpha-mannosidase-like protein 2 [Haliotis rubra]
MKSLFSYKKIIFGRSLYLILIFLSSHLRADEGKTPRNIDMSKYRERVVQMFQHAYDSYLKYAYPYDELRPLSCDGQDTWGSYSLTLVDALDTLIIMGNHSEFRRIAQMLIDKSEDFFDMDINASVFETNIRVVGGLISAHLLSHKADMVLEPGWPCSGPLLRMAEVIARKLLPAFDTPTGMPYGTVNLRNGVPKGETTVTCTAGVGTFLVEFGALSRLTGDPIFEKVAMRALRTLWDIRSQIGMVGNHVDVGEGKWTAIDSGIGGGIDSYFEYLAKGAVMFQIPELLEMFKEYEATVEKYVKRDDWYMWANMKKGGITLPVFTSLDCYWPGVQGMMGSVEKGMKTLHNYHQVWKQFGFTPEYYNIPKSEVHQGREGYPLRPELVESAMYLYQATRDPYILEIGIDILEAIEHSSRTPCGYATVKDVRNHRLEDRMESFFLAETTKYLYLLFDEDNFIHNQGNHGKVIKTPSGECVIDTGGYVFNTEAHPMDVAAIHCCSAQKAAEDAELQEFHDKLNLLELFDITEVKESLIEGKKLKKKVKVVPKEKVETVKVVVEADSNDEEVEDAKEVVSTVSSQVADDGRVNVKVTYKTVDTSDHKDKSVENNHNESSEIAPTVPEVSSKSKSENPKRENMLKLEEKTTYIDRKKHSLHLAAKLLEIFTGLTGASDKNISEHPNINHLYRELKDYELNYTYVPSMMKCQALPFHMRLSVMGEMFDDN